jgi:hypothetical protein
VRGWPLAAVLITVLVLLFAATAGLYASGPEHKTESTGCKPEKLGCSSALVSRRTNAWERIKGAVTGEP